MQKGGRGQKENVLFSCSVYYFLRDREYDFEKVLLSLLFSPQVSDMYVSVYVYVFVYVYVSLYI